MVGRLVPLFELVPASYGYTELRIIQKDEHNGVIFAGCALTPDCMKWDGALISPPRISEETDLWYCVVCHVTHNAPGSKRLSSVWGDYNPSAASGYHKQKFIDWLSIFTGIDRETLEVH